MLLLYAAALGACCCTAGLLRWTKLLQLTRQTLQQDLASLERIFGELNQSADAARYYHHTTDRDYRLLELFNGPGMHTCLQAPQPIGRQGGGTRQPVLVHAEVRSCNAARVLEVGCGRGHCTLFLAGLCRDVQFEGIDLVKRQIDVATAAASAGAGAGGNATFRVCDVLSMETPCLEQQYDVVFGCESLCHMDTREKAARFAEVAARLLRCGGRLVIVDGFRGKNFDTCTPEQQAAMRLAEGGFKIRQMPSKALWAELCAAQGLRLVRDVDLTQEALPFWTLGWKVAHTILSLFPWAVRLLANAGSVEWQQTASNFISVTMTAHAMRWGAAEYGLLVFEKV